MTVGLATCFTVTVLHPEHNPYTLDDFIGSVLSFEENNVVGKPFLLVSSPPHPRTPTPELCYKDGTFVLLICRRHSLDQIYRRFKRTLFIRTKQPANFRGNPLCQATKRHLNKSNGEKRWKTRWKATPLICFWLSCIVSMSSTWNNVGMTVICLSVVVFLPTDAFLCVIRFTCSWTRETDFFMLLNQI